METITIKVLDYEAVSDGYHTIGELYDHRITLWIALCRMTANVDWSEWGIKDPTVWRSKVHSDGTSYDGWFLLGINEEKGEQITYHIPLERWEETDFASTLERAPEWDGHTSKDVVERIKKFDP